MILNFGQPFFFREYMFWKQHSALTNAYITDRLCELRDRFGELSLFRMDGSDVQIHLDSGATADDLRIRIDFYLNLFREVARSYPSTRPFVFGACLGDGGFPDQEFPIFSFQKLRRSMNLLLPDIDVLGNDFYRSSQFDDDIIYEHKHNSAIFVGSTTGATPDDMYLLRRRRITQEKVISGRVPRIASALFFRKHRERVVFDLPCIVQVVDRDVFSFIESLGFGGNVRMPLKEQFKHKFMISMDGNGAACSRLALALASNCVPLKYKSDCVLHYFPLLNDGVNILEVSNDQDVLRFVDAEIENPGLFERVADNGRSLFVSVFDRANVVKYTASVLSAYQDVTRD